MTDEEINTLTDEELAERVHEAHQRHMRIQAGGGAYITAASASYADAARHEYYRLAAALDKRKG